MLSIVTARCVLLPRQRMQTWSDESRDRFSEMQIFSEESANGAVKMQIVPDNSVFGSCCVDFCRLPAVHALDLIARPH
jgi:hypothetical protein